MHAITHVAVFGLLASVRAIPTKRQTDDLNPYPDKKKLVFKDDGSFKVTVFSDLHFGENPWESWGPEHDASTIKLMGTVLGDEKPDYAVLNGDLVTGENTFPDNATKLIDEIMKPMNDAGLPFSSTYGNHDNDKNIDHAAEIKEELAVAKNSYTRTVTGVGGAKGPGNYWVPVFAKDGDQAPALVMWFFDSQAGKNPDGSGIVGTVDDTVADWITSESDKMDKGWGDAGKRATLAFVHIPPKAIEALQANVDPTKNPGLNDDKLGDGSVQDSDGKWYDTVSKLKNLKAIVSGHDHGNEWCAREPSKDVIFCYDKHSGYGGYDHGWGQGVRNIVINSDPTKGADTWIRMENGDKKAQVTLDGNYKR